MLSAILDFSTYMTTNLIGEYTAGLLHCMFFALHYLQHGEHGCLENSTLKGNLRWNGGFLNFLNIRNYELICFTEAVALRMFSLTDIQPGPSDIGEILVKVRSVE